MSAAAFLATGEWRTAFPGALSGIMIVRGVSNPAVCDALEDAKRALESRLRERWYGKSRADIRADPILEVYGAYDRRLGQNYHVQMQIESIALKGKSIPTRAALVEAMFMAELETGLLTAVHDLDAISLPITIDVATGAETYTRYDGIEEACKPGDMYMHDSAGVLTSIAQGPTAHCRVTDETKNAVFCVYAPSGIPRAALAAHFAVVQKFVETIEHGALFEVPAIIEAGREQ